jgi:hypothetical protein
MNRTKAIPADVAAAIRQLIADHLSGPEGPVSHENIRRAQALPVYSDIGGTLLLTPTGEILRSPIDSTGSPTPEPDLRWRLLALVRAADKYPQLMQLRPIPDQDSTQCLVCTGNGSINVGRVVAICGTCHGLGWRRQDV